MFRTASIFALLLATMTPACQDKAKTNDVTTTSSAAASTPTAAPKEGDTAPDVDMALQDGRHVKLSSLKGQNVALYFYPKDQTTGCTIEAQNFRDRFADLKSAGI
ncbi:MAG TPA: redoxin domain-containing protein, partial [Labilithrix sp.]